MRHFTTNKRPPTFQERFQSKSPTPDSMTHQPQNGITGEGRKDNNYDDEVEEDDYMNMTFTETPTIPETSLQRRQRLHAEGLKRGAVPSKAELLAQERARREEGLARSLLHAAPDTGASSKPKSKGFAMMAKMGYQPGAKLGAKLGTDDHDDDARVAEPLPIEVREDRGGIGLAGERKRKLQEAAEAQGVDTKKPRVEELDPVAYRDRMAREREAARKETLVGAAQKIAERMDEDRAAGMVDGDEEAERERKCKAGRPAAASSRPLKAVPVLYRGLVRHREEKERDRRMRHDLETSMGTLSAKLPAYEDDEGMDADDVMALGRGEKKTVYMVADDLDEEDEELDAWEALEVGERLTRLVDYLRTEYRYCFWCKFAYPDESMEGCPGVTEEDHD